MIHGAREPAHLRCSLSGVPEVVLALHLQPEIRRGAQRRRQPQRHSSGDPRMAIQYAGQRRPRHAQAARRFLDGHPAKVILQDLSRMCRIENHTRLPPGAGSTRRRHSAGFSASATWSPPEK